MMILYMKGGGAPYYRPRRRTLAIGTADRSLRLVAGAYLEVAATGAADASPRARLYHLRNISMATGIILD
jgi:hypothetical protein